MSMAVPFGEERFPALEASFASWPSRRQRPSRGGWWKRWNCAFPNSTNAGRNVIRAKRHAAHHVGQRRQNLTVARVIASPHTLHIGLVWWSIGMLLALMYFSIV